MIHIASRCITSWMLCCIILIGFFMTDNSFYRFGPSPNLIILGTCIDTYFKYTIIIVYCIFNTCIRAINHQIILPWITLVVQNINAEKKNAFMIYEVVLCNSFYNWIDWFICIQLLFSQVDIILVELIMDILVTRIVTHHYLNASIIHDMTEIVVE